MQSARASSALSSRSQSPSPAFLPRQQRFARSQCCSSAACLLGRSQSLAPISCLAGRENCCGMILEARSSPGRGLGSTRAAATAATSHLSAGPSPPSLPPRSHPQPRAPFPPAFPCFFRDELRAAAATAGFSQLHSPHLSLIPAGNLGLPSRT